MKNQRSMLGLVLVLIGGIILLKSFNIISGPIFFNGWWTLFLIVPALMSMSRQGVTVGNAILLTLGVGFLLNEQGWNFTQYLVPAIFIVLGVAILIKRQ